MAESHHQWPHRTLTEERPHASVRTLAKTTRRWAMSCDRKMLSRELNSVA